MQLLLSVSISLWIAGGCLFSCTGTANGAESKHEPQTVVASSSCHAKHAKQSTGIPSFVPGPLGTPKDCPLAVNATAVASKKSGHLPEPGRGPVSALPLITKTTLKLNSSRVVTYLPNRGPTHLLCCVFLI